VKDQGLENQDSISDVVSDIEKEKTKKQLSPNIKLFRDEGINLLLTNVRALVDNPEKVTVTVNQGEQTTVFEIKVDRSDLGKVIGKQGATARALRKILYGFSIKMKARSLMEIIE